MNTLLNIMDTLYGDTKTLTIVYIVGAVLLLIFIILLIVSLRKPTEKVEHIIEEPKINEEPVEDKEEQIIEGNGDKEETPKEDIIESKVEEPIEVKENVAITDPLENTLNNLETKNIDDTNKTDEIQNEEVTSTEIASEVSDELPNKDDLVENEVDKTYEKNEQFSSVYVGENTANVKLDKVLDDLNVDKDVKEAILPKLEETSENTVDSINVEVKNVETEIKHDMELPKIADEKVTEPETVEKKEEIPNSLDSLKASLENKKAEINSKQDELKAKLNSLKNANK